MMKIGRWLSAAVLPACMFWMAAGSVVAVKCPAQAPKSASADAHIVDVTPIAEVFADGWKVSAVAVHYDRKIREASLKPEAYSVITEVAGQKILRAYTNNESLMTKQRGLNGDYVILELSTDYVLPVPVAAAEPPRPPAGQPGGPGGAPAARPAPVKEDLPLNAEVVTKVGEISWEPGFHPATLKSSKKGGGGKWVAVNQTGTLNAVDGMVLTATTSAKENVYCRNLIVDGFLKADYITETKGNAKYNIRFPRNYDPAKKYPVIFFLSDKDAISHFTHAEPLLQGQGGVIWSSPEDEARHPAIVVTAVSRGVLVDEKGEVQESMGPGGQKSKPYETLLALLDYLQQKVPSIDKGRIYLTGQGDGARVAVRMMIDRPEYFAAALLFAPDYDAAQWSKLAKQKVWIVATEGDGSWYASTEAGVASLKTAGAKVSKSVWDGKGKAADLAASVKKMAADGSNIHYSVWKRGTALPQGVEDNAVNNHAYTWRAGYSIDALRDWLLAQK